ncbi:MAG: lysophospholipid acyltransferase family protein [Verrucomicrobiota bacterium]
MLEFSDAPYRFFEAKPSKPLIWLSRWLNRVLFLPGKNHRIAEIEVQGGEDLRESINRGERILFVVNHPSHSDPQVITEVHRRLGISSCFMAAYDVFLRSPLTGWVMQRLGNFSIDREGSDRKAMTAAIDVIKEGKLSLTIFPEGNVYLTNDRVTPFLDGTAFIAIKAQASLKERPVKVVPISLKFTHLTTPRQAITERMLQLGQDSEYEFPEGSTTNPMNAVLGLGEHIVGRYLRSHGYEQEFAIGNANLHETLTAFGERLVVELETHFEQETSPEESLVDRIRKIRTKIHQLRTDPDKTPDGDLDSLADKAILAFRLHGHLTPYLVEQPTIDRYDETVERISEDFYSEAMPRTGPRRVIARIHPGIDVSSLLNEAEGKARNAVGPLTRAMEKAVQDGVDEINATNSAPGATLVDDVRD